MKIKTSAFYLDVIKLTPFDVLKLIFGKHLKICGNVLGLWTWPDKEGRSCEENNG